jgi:hypothetical protein
MSYSRAQVVAKIRQRINIAFGGSFAAYVATLDVDAIVDDVIREEVATQAREIVRQIFISDTKLAQELSAELSIRP